MSTYIRNFISLGFLNGDFIYVLPLFSNLLCAYTQGLKNRKKSLKF